MIYTSVNKPPEKWVNPQSSVSTGILDKRYVAAILKGSLPYTYTSTNCSTFSSRLFPSNIPHLLNQLPTLWIIPRTKRYHWDLQLRPITPKLH